MIQSVCCEQLAEHGSGLGPGTSLLPLAALQVLENWTETGRTFRFGRNGGIIVLVWSWNILREVVSNKPLFIANFRK